MTVDELKDLLVLRCGILSHCDGEVFNANHALTACTCWFSIHMEDRHNYDGKDSIIFKANLLRWKHIAYFVFCFVLYTKNPEPFHINGSTGSKPDIYCMKCAL